MDTTSTAALEVLLGLPPFSVWMMRKAMAACLRIRDAAEVFAIWMVVHREDVKNCAEGQTLICSHSQTALRVISSPRTRSILVQEYGDALESLARQKEMELVAVCWVPGHMRILGNED
ncbi:hypothetical protein NQ315_008320 [Exocentrus adspersus]|uniref:Uncharacterized protein n=1 Tax=Exocentrus adspersus TaxID=1586481 RepID=A0AAV8VDS2_9CUCU|nr:hypothetical protein NQ315_008320 [Exocentrus adspersus]